MRRIKRRIGDLFFGGIWRRVGWILIAFFLGMGTAIWLREEFFPFWPVPAQGQLSPFGGKPVFNEPGSVLGSIIEIGWKTGLVTASPILWLYLMELIKPWIPGRWWWNVVGFSVSSAISTVAGLAFVYYVMLPRGLGFLLNFGNNIAEPVILLSAYTGLLTSMMLAFGVIFNIPLFMYLTVRIGVMSYRRFVLFRKFFIPTAIFFGTLLSPGADLVNALLLIVPLILLYEVGLFVAWMADPTQGDYLFIKTTWSGVSWVVRRPVVVFRRFRRFLLKHGIWS